MSMRITAVELKVLPHLVVVTVKTDAGIDGHGFAQKGLSVAQAIADTIRPQVLGEDPFDYEKIWHKMLDADRWGGLTPFNAYGAVDVALWDVRGHEARKPVHALLGGAFRDRVRPYATGLYYRGEDVKDLPSAVAQLTRPLRRKNSRVSKAAKTRARGFMVITCAITLSRGSPAWAARAAAMTIQPIPIVSWPVSMTVTRPLGND